MAFETCPAKYKNKEIFKTALNKMETFKNNPQKTNCNHLFHGIKSLQNILSDYLDQDMNFTNYYFFVLFGTSCVHASETSPVMLSIQQECCNGNLDVKGHCDF